MDPRLIRLRRRLVMEMPVFGGSAALRRTTRRLAERRRLRPSSAARFVDRAVGFLARRGVGDWEDEAEVIRAMPPLPLVDGISRSPLCYLAG